MSVPVDPATPVALLYDPIFLAHRPPDAGGSGHPERPRRLARILERLEETGGATRFPILAPGELHVDVLAAVHDPEHVESLRRMSDAGGGYIDTDTYAGPRSFRAAIQAAGAVARGVELVLGGEYRRAFALARPPGHHATRSRAMGFCLFNSVAVAAARARAAGLRRLLVLDWDVHHGNGTQEIFVADPDLLYLSTHQWPWYPGTGALDEIGVGKGRGTTINVPLPAGVGDDGFRRVFEEVVVPAARRFAPELILLSAGYDAHAADPLGGMRITTAGFGAMTAVLTTLAGELCEGRLVACLEGGYDLEALAGSVVATLNVMAGDTPVQPDEPASPGSETPSDTVVSAVRRTHGLTGG